MGTVSELREALMSLDIRKKVTELNKSHSKEFLSANKDQMWDGQKPDGSDITPSYLNDPYFKTRKQAEGYANWKMKLSRNPKRNKYAPNLYINGYFYSTLTLNAVDLAIEINDGFGNSVASDHPGVLGVSQENLRNIAEGGYLDEFWKYVEGITGLKA
jgi:hypothetical protein